MITTVDILGVPFSITTSDRITGSDGRNLDGEITYNVAKIEIVNGMPPEVERRVLLHEIMHGIFSQTGHENYRLDEDLIEAVANSLVYLLRRNPALVAYLVETDVSVK